MLLYYFVIAIPKNTSVNTFEKLISNRIPKSLAHFGIAIASSSLSPLRCRLR